MMGPNVWAYEPRMNIKMKMLALSNNDRFPLIVLVCDR
jgi:hypothetical protein